MGIVWTCYLFLASEIIDMPYSEIEVARVYIEYKAPSSTVESKRGGEDPFSEIQYGG